MDSGQIGHWRDTRRGKCDVEGSWRGGISLDCNPDLHYVGSGPQLSVVDMGPLVVKGAAGECASMQKCTELFEMDQNSREARGDYNIVESAHIGI
jgi:hypothetical protein